MTPEEHTLLREQRALELIHTMIKSRDPNYEMAESEDIIARRAVSIVTAVTEETHKDMRKE